MASECTDCNPEDLMSNETNAVLALKNAWNGAVASADRLRELAPSVQGLAEDADPTALDFETYRRVSLGHANAAMALRGLVEELERQAGKG
jgi:hypothetical protein